ncbi:MAG: nitroreductase [Halioglobus sp.]|nr:nitroreductase [Halioglobus sp.]
MTDRAAIFDDIVKSRRSLRAFLPRAADQETLDDIFAVAQRAPSNCNTQPWITHVVSGAALESLRSEMPDRFMSGNFSMDFPYDGAYEGVYKERQHAAAQALYDSVGIEREDKARRHEQFMRNFTFFDAPHVAFLFLPEPFGLREAADLGMYAQTLMLSFTAHGMGSCPQTALSFQANYVREKLGIDEKNKLLFGISFGYPDMDDPSNSCLTDRAGNADAVSFHS